MQLDLSSFSKFYDKEKLPNKKIDFIVNWLEKKGFQVKLFLDNKNLFSKSKKSAFVKVESLDFSSLFSNKDLLPFSKISKYFHTNLFDDNDISPNNLDGLVAGLKVKSTYFGAFYLWNPKVDGQNLITTIDYFKHLVQSNFRELLLSKKLRKNTSDLRDKKLEIESFIDISELLSGTSESEILFQKLLEYLVFTMNASKGVILSKEPNSGIYELKATLGIKDDLDKKIFRENKGVLSILKKEKKSLLLNFSEDLPLLSFSKKNSVIGPFLNGKNLNGCIILYDKESRKGFVDFNQYDLRFFNSIVKKISLSYNNIILLDNVKKSKKLIDNIMSSISTGIVKINLMGEIEYINDSAIEIFQLDKSILLDNHYAIVFESNPDLTELIEFAESRNHILYEENLRVKKQDSNETNINLTISPVFDDGVNSGSVISFEDLSDINKVKSTFKKYVSENIVDELLLNEDSLELGGVEQEVCVLFSDIRGFTSMSERMEPSKVVKLLNSFFDKMIDVVFKYNGTLDKIIGDELMVLYGAPLKKADDILNAVKTAKEMFTTLDEFNVKMLEEGYPKLNIGIGINYGKVICGNIGSEQQMNYTVIGDTVNLASRLCSAAKPGEIIISDSVYKNLDDTIGFSLNEKLSLKGKKQPVKNWKFTY
ncbi:MAG: adenylate/guanylate cyclase domain-containing protein [Bacteroidota bacterium]|nr:adenylate/guanylate cyclase domain-containing protein [Bacteroidota bacterium]MEC8599643.1 adenylate/guanylate cyclase domain-containing protein [Bacteroidota bacterium]